MTRRKVRRSGLSAIPADAESGDLGLGLGTAPEALAELISCCSTPRTVGLQRDWD